MTHNSVGQFVCSLSSYCTSRTR